MLDTLHIKHFTVFQEARFRFSPGLNLILADNGTGKTHVLMGYLFSRAWTDLTAKRARVTAQRAEAGLATAQVRADDQAEWHWVRDAMRQQVIRIALQLGPPVKPSRLFPQVVDPADA